MAVEVRVGDCLDVLRTLDAESVQCCVTSPPYFGLRDYGHVGQIGLEPTPDAYVAKLVEVFAEVRRVLKHDGTLWLNLGDSYASSGGERAYGSSDGGTGRGPGARRFRRTTSAAPDESRAECRTAGEKTRLSSLAEGASLASKNLVGIPWRVAFALQADGWYLRSDIIWHKPNPMPESVADRPTKAHEYLFLLAKSGRYLYNADAIREPVAPSQVGRVREDVVGGTSHVERGQHSKGGTYRGSSFNRGICLTWIVILCPLPVSGRNDDDA